MKIQRKVLMVDDNKAITGCLNCLLTKHLKCDTMELNSGDNILLDVKTFQPDLILLDMVMPKYSGCELAAMLRNDPQTVNIPILFLTSIVNESEARLYNNSTGDYPILSKGCDMKHIIATIKNLLPG
jgi:CheY-like chemotaxis protein